MENLIASLLLSLRLLMAVALYLFLFWALLTMWRDLKALASQADHKSVPPIRLIMQLEGVEGSEDELFHLSEITIGRHPSNHWTMGHETVSSRHARLIYHHEQWWLEDLGSRNGTFLNGERVTESLVINSKDKIRCGQALFEVFLESNPAGGKNV